MKKSCFFILTVWTGMIIIAGCIIVWYLQLPRLVVLSNSSDVFVPSTHSHQTVKLIDNTSVIRPQPNPLLKYCNLPKQRLSLGLEGDFNGDYDLLGVITIFRHGDRGPLVVISDTQVNCSTFVTDNYKSLENSVKKYKTRTLQDKLLPKSDYCKPGLLSKQGASQLVELGYELRQAYEKYFNFSDPNTTNRIVANTTPYSRTIQSLYSLLFGLVGPKSFLRVSLQSKSDVPFCFKHCRCEAANNFEKQHKKELNDRLNEAEHRLGNFSGQVKMISNSMAGKSTKDFLLPSTLKDIMLHYVCHNQALPCNNRSLCLDYEFAGSLEELLQFEADLSANGLNLKKASILKAYGLINNIDQQIQSWISMYKKRQFQTDGSNFPRFIFYSGHDLTLMYLLSALSLYDGFLPKYASRFTIEVLSKKEQHFARILWNGVEVTPQICTSSHQPFSYCSARFLPKLIRTEMKRLFQTNNFWEACEL